MYRQCKRSTTIRATIHNNNKSLDSPLQVQPKYLLDPDEHTLNDVLRQIDKVEEEGRGMFEFEVQKQRSKAVLEGSNVKE